MRSIFWIVLIFISLSGVLKAEEAIPPQTPASTPTAPSQEPVNTEDSIVPADDIPPVKKKKKRVQLSVWDKTVRFFIRPEYIPKKEEELDLESVKLPEPVMYGDKRVLGWVERVTIYPYEKTFKAKLDTGAKTTSVRAKIIEQYKKNGEEWVRFKVDRGHASDPVIEAKIIRWVKIKHRIGRRPVVSMVIGIGGKKIRGEVNLSPRQDFVYPVLIGRNMLRGKFVIDVSESHMSSPKKKKVEAADEN
jgi:hypothetical protein